MLRDLFGSVVPDRYNTTISVHYREEQIVQYIIYIADCIYASRISFQYTVRGRAWVWRVYIIMFYPTIVVLL